MWNFFRKKITKFYALFFILLIPKLASAHEVYVLSKSVIKNDIAIVSPNPFSIVVQDEHQFLVWGLVTGIAVIGVFLLSITKAIENFFDPYLYRIKHYAPLIARLTLGLCFLASAYYQGLFGPELPFSEFSQGYSALLTILLYALGSLLVLGIFTRAVALISLGVFALGVFHYGFYMLTYANYLGEILINIVLGDGAFSLGNYLFKQKSIFEPLLSSIEEYGFFVLRVLFGTAVIFASWYAKFIHSQLALDTVNQYHLTNYFHFAPLFVVLGAFIIETLIGLFFIFGFEVRFTALVFLTFLTLSLLYFGEAVWPHIILIGVNIVFFIHGYDRFTLEGVFFKKNKLEPVL